MSENQYANPTTQSLYTPAHAKTLQRQCTCDGTPGPDGERVECHKKRTSLQGYSMDQIDPFSLPPIVREVLHSPGQPLDPTTCVLMGARLGHNFGQVRVHSDARAAESARAVNALAYTAGRNVVFGARQYSPGTTAGRQLLAHELVHVVRQARPGGRAGPEWSNAKIGAGDAPQEHEADIVSRQVAAGVMPANFPADSPRPAQPATLQRQLSPAYQLNLTIDERGQAEVTVSGPNLPVISKPTLGIRRNADGTYDILAGGQGKTVAASEIPDMLRDALRVASPGAPPPQRTFRMPPCRGLQSARGDRFMTYDEYRVSQMLSPDLLPMSAALYEARIKSCKQEPLELPKPPAQLEEAPPAILPKDEALA